MSEGFSITSRMKRDFFWWLIMSVITSGLFIWAAILKQDDNNGKVKEKIEEKVDTKSHG